jgi:hypothetical protein
MSLIYVEYTSRRPGIALHEFHAGVREGQSGWAGEYGADVLLLNVGRTWRIGPHPEYLTVWYSEHAGLERLDEWQSIFESGQAKEFESSFSRVAVIDSAGCYEPLVAPARGATGPYAIEFFTPRAEATSDDLAAEIGARQANLPDAALRIAARRIGSLGPDPAGLLVWELPSFAAVQRIVDTAPGTESPISVVATGLYANVGREIL